MRNLYISRRRNRYICQGQNNKICILYSCDTKIPRVSETNLQREKPKKNWNRSESWILSFISAGSMVETESNDGLCSSLLRSLLLLRWENLQRGQLGKKLVKVNTVIVVTSIAIVIIVLQVCSFLPGRKDQQLHISKWVLCLWVLIHITRLILNWDNVFADDIWELTSGLGGLMGIFLGWYDNLIRERFKKIKKKTNKC